MEPIETIICWKCGFPKHPCLFTPNDVKQARMREDGKRVSTCRSCRNSYKPKASYRRGQGLARLSLKTAFEKALIEGRAG